MNIIPLYDKIRAKVGDFMATLYDRIKSRRTELGLTVEELAHKMGYKDKSSISKIENGKADIPQSKIAAFADALQTTPAYLMGWEEKNTPNTETSVEGIDLTQSEEEIIKLLRQMDKEQIIQAILALQKIISDQNGGKGQ